MTDQKDTLNEARSALQSMLAGVKCTPMEKEFFIRGFTIAHKIQQEKLFAILEIIRK
jgi:hypothetical protein